MVDRAAAEDDANQSRVSNDAKVDTGYAKTRLGLVEKYQSLDREARSDDEQRRRMIIDDAMVGESKAKADFAASSRQIASEFDSLRESVKNEYNRARGDAASQLDAGNRKAATEQTQALQPLSTPSRSPTASAPAGDRCRRVWQVQARARSARPGSRVVLEIHRTGR